MMTFCAVPVADCPGADQIKVWYLCTWGKCKILEGGTEVSRDWNRNIPLNYREYIIEPLTIILL